MLGKTANGLFWMYRYMERAENTARLIETGQRIALTRLNQTDGEWASVLKSGDCWAGYNAAHDEVSRDLAIDWMLRDKDNPSSVISSISAARQNARLVRTAITGEVWEAVNSAFMSLKQNLSRRVGERDLPAILRLIRQHSALVRGVTIGTMQRNDIYDFARLGTFLERADNTARILDVKYYVLLPSARSVGTSLDNVQWETILRSVSARGGFRMEYGGGGGPRDITHFLILDRRMPRSLAFCASKLCNNLKYLSENGEYGQASIDRVGALQNGLLSRNIDDIFEHGLHEFLQQTLRELTGISHQIEQDFRFYD
ncbi:alpha-E domain-containing protein [Marivita sp. S2033]|uniref:alpha-E domain-containing protein n=1 Tax=Marivita sp. S2033 TaxID=3373187 RepID=UPI003982474B